MQVLFLTKIGAKEEGQSPIFLEELQTVKVKEGRTARLECKLDGKPSPNVEWRKNDETLSLGSRVRGDKEGQYCILTVKNCTPEDKGVYMCVAFNNFGSIATSCELIIDSVVTEPVFIEKLNSMDVLEGNEATFSVKVASNTTPSVKWLKDNNEIARSGRHMLTSIVNDGIYTLVIRNCETRDNGRYSCIVTNKTGESQSTASLNVKSLPRLPVFKSEDKDEAMEVKEGDKLQIAITITSKPNPKVKWYKDGMLLLSGAKVYIRNTGDKYSLEIPRVNKMNAGIYKCVATNAGGTASKVFNVKISGIMFDTKHYHYNIMNLQEFYTKCGIYLLEITVTILNYFSFVNLHSMI